MIWPDPRTQPWRAAAAWASAVVAVLALVVGVVLATNEEARAARAKASELQKPSFVVIQTDDQTLAELYQGVRMVSGAEEFAMPNTLQLLGEKGITFNRYYTPYSLCTPSRVSLLTGRYAHNDHVQGNVPPNGGWTGFQARQAYSHNLATWLQGAGYRTIHIGKILNGYGDAPFSPGTEVAPGWNSWHTILNSDTDHYAYGYLMNNNGVVEGPYGDSGSWETREYGEVDDAGCPYAPLNGKPCYYETDKFNQLAAEELAATSPEQPFYMQVDYTSPHGDFRRPAGPQPATRDIGRFAGAPLPDNRAEGFNEGNVNDKPRFIREAPYLNAQEIHTYRVYYENCLAALVSVDEGVKEILDQLGALHRLRNTYIVFTSDNGFFFGQHRLVGGKFLAYESSTHLPLIIRGPGIKPDTATGQFASTIDIAPTILELAEVTPDKSIDGVSLVPYMKEPTLRSRRPLLFESFVQTDDVEQNGQAATGETTAAGPARGKLGVAGASARPRRSAPEDAPAHASVVAPPKNYYGIRLGPYKYIEWPDGEKELYDINKDPYELNNIVRNPNFFPIRAFLHKELERLEECSGRTCQEVSEKLPPTRREQVKVRQEKEKEQREREREQEQREEERREREREKAHNG
ncbi:MAG TPA: sulfatase [Solirubrobacterales bacterium]|nr:sulfatase [Solirubrobacterales bacterium]